MNSRVNKEVDQQILHDSICYMYYLNDVQCLHKRERERESS